MADTDVDFASERGPTYEVLHFLSHASNQTLSLILVVLSTVTYLVLGRIGLLLIGVVCGVTLHANWENAQAEKDSLGAAETKRRREAGVDVVRRALDWQERKRIDTETFQEISSIERGVLSSSHGSDFADFPPATRTALRDLVDAVIRDYVMWWYAPILPSDSSFPSSCRRLLTSFCLSLSAHLSRKRPADTFLNFLTNSTSIFIVFLGELSGALMDLEAVDMDVPDAIELYLEKHPSSSLANLVDLTQQERKLKLISEDILQTFLDSKALNCEAVKAFLRETLAGLILEMTIKSCSTADFINGWIVYLLEDRGSDVRNVTDAGVGRASGIETEGLVPLRDLAEQPSKTHDSGTNGGNSATGTSSSKQSKISKAEDAMEEAMFEAKRLSELMAAQDATSGPICDDDVLPSEATAASSQAFLDDKANGAALDPPYTTIISSALPVDINAQNVINVELSPRRHAPAASFPLTSSQSDVNGIGSGSGSHGTFLQAHSDGEASATFDQFLTSQQLASSGTSSNSGLQPALTLHNANVTIFDDALPGEKTSNIIRSKPTADFLLQVEPISTIHTGWMMARKYADFETLHEVLRQISRISGFTAFTNKHNSVPTWKNQTKESLRQAMEVYLRDALSDTRLAESEGMKRFLEKDQGLGRPSAGTAKGLLGFPTPAAFEAMGKGMLDVLVSAPKGAAGGGKALYEGVTGVFGQKKQTWPTRTANTNRSVPISSSGRASDDAGVAGTSAASYGRASQDDRRLSTHQDISHDQNLRKRTNTSSHSARTLNNTATTATLKSDASEDSLLARTYTKIASRSAMSFDETDSELILPPLPTEIADDYSSGTDSPRMSSSTNDVPGSRFSSSAAASSDRLPLPVPTKPRKDALPLTEQETQVAVELFFAMINELYTLSSAWNFRRTILNAAKTFFLRPGNPQLEAIRILIQDTIIAANTSDAGLSAHIRKLRENSLPTEAELKAWPPPLVGKEQEQLRAKARKLLVERGMPQALTSVMGAAASGEALGRVFDALQVEAIARGLMFAFLLQGVRALMH
ncbi:hypothetical protein MMC13_006565 [Lambiella insularis]|nr:hypothetical protein [Lambiella insularis]